MSFGEKLKEARTSNGLSIGDLSRKTDIHRSTISYLEQGIAKGPNGHTVRELAIALNVSADYLLEIPGRGDA